MSAGNEGKADLAEHLLWLTEQPWTGRHETTGHAYSPPPPAEAGDGVIRLAGIIQAFSNLRRDGSAAQRVTAEPPPRHAGDRFAWGHLQVQERLGGGSFGDVYRAYDSVLERDVALKLRRDTAITGRGYILEARRLARVRHANVLAIHGVAVHDGRAGLWCDLVDGQALNDWISSHGACDRETVLAYGVALASALHAVHCAGLIHGDVKPGNVMRGNDGRVVLMDFGTAVEEHAEGVRAFFGSPLAMAPEQIAGERIGTAVDIYGLGVVLYYLACAQYPVQAPTLEALRRLHERAVAPDWSALPARAGADLRRLLQRMLAADPKRRPTAAAVQAQLQAIIAAPQQRRRRLLLASTFAALTVALTVSLFALHRVDIERGAATRAYQRELAAREFSRQLLDAPRPGADGADVRVVDILVDAPAIAEQRFANDPLALATALGDLGRSHYAIGARVEARPLLRRASALGEQHGMARHELLDLRITLAAADAYLEPTDAHCEVLAALHAQSRDTLGTGHPVTFQAALEWSAAVARQARDRPADNVEQLLQQMLAPAQDGQAASATQLGTAYLTLVNLYVARGRWDEAEALVVEGINYVEQTQGAQSAAALVLRSTAASIDSQRGRHARAEAQLTALLADTERRYGPRHHNLRTILNNLAVSQRMQGRTEAAIGHLQRALELAQAQLGESHVEVLSIRDNLASALADDGATEAARTMREATLAIKTAAFGAQHPGTVLSALNLAEQYIEDGDAAEALQLAEKARDDALAIFGDRHLFALEAAEIAARAQLALGQSAAARQHLQQAFARKRDLLGEDDPYTLRSAGFLAAAHAASGDAAAAIALLQATLPVMRRSLAPGQADLRQAEDLYATLKR